MDNAPKTIPIISFEYHPLILHSQTIMTN